MKREEGYFRGFNDSELFYQSWIVEKPRGGIVITHGLGEHSECYQRLIEGLSPLNMNIYGWDLRGHGRSEGKRGVIYDFLNFCEDLKIFLKYIQDQHPISPLFLLGHSMGGLICNRTLISLTNTETLKINGLILSSPLCALAIHVPKIRKIAGKVFAKWLPDVAFRQHNLGYNKLSRDRDVINEYQHDHLRHDKISPQLFFDLNHNCKYLLENASKIKLPVIVMQAGYDTIVSAGASKTYFEKVSSIDKTFNLYEGYYHEIFNDIGREKVYTDLISWLECRLPKTQ